VKIQKQKGVNPGCDLSEETNRKKRFINAAFRKKAEIPKRWGYSLPFFSFLFLF
jgi:hypothetical protein